jgi:hypothetical protein
MQRYLVPFVTGLCYLSREREREFLHQKDVGCDQCLFIRCFSLNNWGKSRKSLSQDSRNVSGTLCYIDIAAILMAALNDVLISVSHMSSVSTRVFQPTDQELHHTNKILVDSISNIPDVVGGWEGKNGY